MNPIFLFTTLWILFSCITTPGYTQTPLWSVVPLTPTSASLPQNATMSVRYTITNNSSRAHTLMMQPITGVSQVSTGSGICSSAFTLVKGASCILFLQISGSQLTDNITNGPVICQQSPTGQPDPLQCYQPPTEAQSLNITKVASCGIGASCGGGVVGCLGGAPYLNLVVSSANLATDSQWGSNLLTNVPGAQSEDDGVSNTAAIINAGYTPPYAALSCVNYRGGGYSDWYLPAPNQLLCVLRNLSLQGLFWWTSQQLDQSADQANSIEFNGATYNTAGFNKTDPFLLRCVRNF